MMRWLIEHLVLGLWGSALIHFLLTLAICEGVGVLFLLRIAK